MQYVLRSLLGRAMFFFFFFLRRAGNTPAECSFLRRGDTKRRQRGKKGCCSFVVAKGPDLLYNASDARDSAYACALKLGHLQLAVEHAAYEGCVLVHLQGRPLQLQLLHDSHGRIQIQDHASCADTPRLHEFRIPQHQDVCMKALADATCPFMTTLADLWIGVLSPHQAYLWTCITNPIKGTEDTLRS